MNAKSELIVNHKNLKKNRNEKDQKGKKNQKGNNTKPNLNYDTPQ